jgi:DNA mismatch repair protein MutL
LRTIAVLPEILINKIAAGEVVERPSSVVKELVENSLDAGATRVKVEIEKGGSKLIKITDNGEGIAKDFLPIALQRHATSKLQSLEELDSITSLGFRGEALPSIASVSLFEIISKTKEQLSGYKIRIEGGKIVEQLDTGAPDGTVIEVRELFFNTPARRKFLKTQVTETRHIIDALNGLALAYPHAGFELVSDGRQLFDYNIADDYRSRVRDVLGGDFEKMVEFSEEGDRISLSGFTIKPEFALKNRAQIYFIVNGRRISSPLLYSALMKAYGEFLIKGRYPQAVIYIFMDPSALDINVSPTKSEVRFSDERAVFGALMSAVRKCLTSHDVIPSGFGSVRQTSREDQERESSDYRERIKAAAERFFTEGKAKPDINQRSFDIKTSPSPASLENIRPIPEKKTDRPQEKEVPEVETRQRIENEAVKRGESVFELAPYRVEQFANLFIIAFSRDQITIIDQHAAHERILYERALKSFDRQKMSSQKMLMPVNIEMEPGMIAGAEEYFELLNNLGFELERFGPRSLAIYAVPAVATGKNPETLVRDLLSDLMEYGDESEDRFKLAAQRFACHTAVRGGDRLSEEMMRGLVRELFKAENPYICPHGRPTIIRYTVEGLRSQFGR